MPERGGQQDPLTNDASADPSASELVTIRRIDFNEAQLAKAKLESEGIPAFIADANVSTMHPLAFSNVQLQVRAGDVDRAEALLAEPAEIHDPDEYVDEPWRCPACHRRGAELVPLTRLRWWIRTACLATLAVPFMVVLADVASIDPRSSTPFWDLFNRYLVLWLPVLAVLSLAVLTHKRTKRCPNCDWTWR